MPTELKENKAKKPKARFKLHASKVDRIAIVDRPAVPDAEILAFKSLDNEPTGNTVKQPRVTPHQELPFIKSRNWTEESAEQRVRNWAKSSNGDTDWAKYKTAFLWSNEEKAENFESYKFLYADIEDNELHAVPQALMSVLSKLAVSDITPEDQMQIIENLKKYYEDLEVEFPKSADQFFTKGEMSPFMRAFAFRGTEAAVNVLQDQIWSSLGLDQKDRNAFVKKSFGDFETIVVGLMSQLGNLNKIQEDVTKFTTEDVLTSFNRGMAVVGMTETFGYFKSNLAYMVMSAEMLEDPSKTFSALIKSMQDRVMKFIPDIVQTKSLDGSNESLFDKAGRILSKQRLKRLKGAIDSLDLIKTELGDMVTEATERYSEKSQEAIMNEEELKKFLEDHLAASTETLVKSIPEIVVSVLQEKGLILTDEQEAEKKAEEEALAKAKEEELAKKEATEKEATDNELGGIKETLTAQGEAIAKIGEAVEAIGKRFAPKATAETEEVEKKEPEAPKVDVFGMAVVGKKKAKQPHE